MNDCRRMVPGGVEIETKSIVLGRILIKIPTDRIKGVILLRFEAPYTS